jgi:type IV pilus assembly protein PilB
MKKIKKILENVLSDEDLENLKFYKWAWCEKCSWTGYKWRLWVHEVLIMEDYLEKPILEEKPASYIQELAVEHWMITIVQDALLKALLWDTTVEEALKLI